MTKTKIVFAPTCPAEVAEALKPLLEKHRSIIPDWCYLLTIYFSEGGNNGDFNASTGSDFPYRKAAITFYAGFLTDTPDRRERDVIHELLHIVTAPVADYAFDIVKRLSEHDERLKTELIAGLKQHVEGTVEDLMQLYRTGRLTFFSEHDTANT